MAETKDILGAGCVISLAFLAIATFTVALIGFPILLFCQGNTGLGILTIIGEALAVFITLGFTVIILKEAT
jgi:hypothetical protein